MPAPLPVPVLHWIIQYGLGFILLAMFVRAIASWFRVDERYAFIRFLARITDTFIEPLRRFVPRIGFLDMSYFASFFLLSTLEYLLIQAIPPGW